MENADGSRTVVVGVTGCIAAYRACEIVRGLQKAGVKVRAMMTENARRFVGEATFAALTGEAVLSDLFGNAGSPIPHIELAQQCDALLIAPCTANMLAKMAHGIADDLVSSTILACTAPVYVAPAMNVHMYENPATQDNISVLRARGVSFIEPLSGMLACGETGKGHIADTDDIVRAVCDGLESSCAAARPRDLTGKHIVITAGPTVEPIDAVRFISNRSSGKMGYALAEAARSRGAEVVLVSGPVSLDPPEEVDIVRVGTAEQMLDAVRAVFPRSDAVICAAAVADMRPQTSYDRKLKKGRDNLTSIALEECPDILAQCGRSKNPYQAVVGFAAETDNLLANAREKLLRKNADLIVANDVNGGAVFGSDDDEVLFVQADSEIKCANQPKIAVAHRILDLVLEILRAKG